ncbi:hypothetical protein AKO1_012222 [Acrasis kona]|uniref:RWP-RK domain-containing protein n=1 Tax=Acrasis kona TaxID=1008807 RepID=A0AAW2Z8A5_9EUKA
MTSKSITFITENPFDKKPRKKHPRLSAEKISKYLSMSQAEACHHLGVSLSTLKRRFYELNMGKWPCKKTRSKSSKSYISTIINKTMKDEKDLSELSSCCVDWLVVFSSI